MHRRPPGHDTSPFYNPPTPPRRPPPPYDDRYEPRERERRSMYPPPYDRPPYDRPPYISYNHRPSPPPSLRRPLTPPPPSPPPLPPPPPPSFACTQPPNRLSPHSRSRPPRSPSPPPPRSSHPASPYQNRPRAASHSPYRIPKRSSDRSSKPTTFHHPHKSSPPQHPPKPPPTRHDPGLLHIPALVDALEQVQLSAYCIFDTRRSHQFDHVSNRLADVFISHIQSVRRNIKSRPKPTVSRQLPSDSPHLSPRSPSSRKRKRSSPQRLPSADETSRRSRKRRSRKALRRPIILSDDDDNISPDEDRRRSGKLYRAKERRQNLNDDLAYENMERAISVSPPRAPTPPPIPNSPPVIINSWESSDSDDTDADALYLPVVRPMTYVPARPLVSDYMSLTPFISDDDDDTETEELRRFNARRSRKELDALKTLEAKCVPLRRRLNPVFPVPGCKRRLQSDFLVLTSMATIPPYVIAVSSQHGAQSIHVSQHLPAITRLPLIPPHLRKVQICNFSPGQVGHPGFLDVQLHTPSVQNRPARSIRSSLPPVYTQNASSSAPLQHIPISEGAHVGNGAVTSNQMQSHYRNIGRNGNEDSRASQKNVVNKGIPPILPQRGVASVPGVAVKGNIDPGLSSRSQKDVSANTGHAQTSLELNREGRLSQSVQSQLEEIAVVLHNTPRFQNGSRHCKPMDVSGAKNVANPILPKGTAPGLMIGRSAPPAMAMGIRAPSPIAMGIRAPPAMAMGQSAPPAMAMGQSAPPAMAMGQSAPPAMAMGQSAPPAMAMGPSAPPTMAMAQVPQPQRQQHHTVPGVMASHLMMNPHAPGQGPGFARQATQIAPRGMPVTHGGAVAGDGQMMRAQAGLYNLAQQQMAHGPVQAAGPVKFWQGANEGIIQNGGMHVSNVYGMAGGRMVPNGGLNLGNGASPAATARALAANEEFKEQYERHYNEQYPIQLARQIKLQQERERHTNMKR